MPIFRLNRAFGVGRDAKVFLNMQGGLTRGVVPNPKQHQEQSEKLRKVVIRQKKALQRKERQVEEQAVMLETLRERLQRKGKLTGKVKKQRLEIFRLRKELDAINGPVEQPRDVLSATRVSEKPGTGTLPDFVIIGAQKGGTSLLYRLIVRHPLVEPAATKELHFFDSNFSEGLSWYGRYFPQRKCVDHRKTVSGEATPSYLLDPRVPERMANSIPDAKLIALLRNPVDRAYSHFQMLVRRGDEIRSFEEATRQEIAGETGRGYLVRGLYAEQLERFSFFAERDHLLVLKSEDFFSRRWDVLGRALAFLNLPPLAPFAFPSSTKMTYPPMDQATRQRLEAYFEPYNQRLHEYLGVDFGW